MQLLVQLDTQDVCASLHGVNRLTVNRSHCFSLMCQGLGSSSSVMQTPSSTQVFGVPSLLICCFECVGQVKRSFSALAHRVDDRVILYESTGTANIIFPHLEKKSLSKQDNKICYENYVHRCTAVRNV